MLAKFGEAVLGTSNPRELNPERFEKIIKALEEADKNGIKDVNRIHIGTIPITDYIKSITLETINYEYKRDSKSIDLLKLFIRYNQPILINLLLNFGTFDVKKEHEVLVINQPMILNLLQHYNNPEAFELKSLAFPLFLMACNRQFEEMMQYLYRLNPSLPYLSKSVTFENLINYQYEGFICIKELKGQTLLNLLCENGNQSSLLSKRFEEEEILDQKQVLYAQQLLKLGSLASVLDKSTRMYPLHYAIVLSNHDLIKVIYDAYPSACISKDQTGKLPLDYASETFRKSLLFQEILIKQEQLSK